MRIIFGIGNPGSRYKFNRHNVGFMFLDYFANSLSLPFAPSTSEYYFAEGVLNDQSFSLIKPSTFVNNSGIAAVEAVHNYNIDIKDFLIVYDDLNLDFPNLQIRIKGGDGGHNGLNSIIYNLASDDFPRLRFGIGNSFEKGKMAEYVLTDFNDKEMVQLKSLFDEGITLAKEFIRGGIKNMLDANSILSKNKISTNLSIDSENSSEK